MQKLMIPLQRKKFNLLKNETKRKRQQMELSILFRHAIFSDPTIIHKDKKIDSIYWCGAFRQYLLNTKKDHKHLDFGLFCGERLCPICGKKKAYRARIKLQTMFKYLNAHYCYKSGKPKYLPVFATFTLPNVPDNIKYFRKTYKKLHHKFYNMMSLHQFCGFLKDRKHNRGIIQGGVSKIEVTYNRFEDTFHLHLHTLLLVHLSYFSSRYYIPFKKWQANWEKQNHWNYRKMGYHLQVRVERPFYKDKNGKRHKATNSNEVAGADREAITEVTGYETKSNDVTTLLDPKHSGKLLDSNYHQAQKAFDTAYFGTKNQNTYTHFGLLKKLARMYNKGLLDEYKPKDSNVYEYMMKAKYQVKSRKYKTGYRKLTKAEMKEREKRGIQTTLTHHVSSFNSKTCGPLEFAKHEAQKELENLTYDSACKMGQKNYLNLCYRAGVVFDKSSPHDRQKSK